MAYTLKPLFGLAKVKTIFNLPFSFFTKAQMQVKMQK